MILLFYSVFQEYNPRCIDVLRLLCWIELLYSCINWDTTNCPCLSYHQFQNMPMLLGSNELFGLVNVGGIFCRIFGCFAGVSFSFGGIGLGFSGLMWACGFFAMDISYLNLVLSRWLIVALLLSSWQQQISVCIGAFSFALFVDFLCCFSVLALFLYKKNVKLYLNRPTIEQCI